MPTEMFEKECRHHGLTDFILEGRGYFRCKKCRTRNVTEKRRRNKQKLIELFGSECKICGYKRCKQALQFHHLDPGKKDFVLSKKMSTSFDKLLEEAGKCILVCGNCHAEIENNIISL